MIALEGFLRGIIERRMKARRFGCDLIFHRGCEPIGTFCKRWKRACLLAGVAGKIPYDLRRTAVRNMIRAGVPERVAMSISGHQDQGGVRQVQHRFGKGPARDDGQNHRLREQLGRYPERGFHPLTRRLAEHPVRNPNKSWTVLGQFAKFWFSNLSVSLRQPFDNTTRKLAPLGRLELPTRGLGNRCSVHLSYRGGCYLFNSLHCTAWTRWSQVGHNFG